MCPIWTHPTPGERVQRMYVDAGELDKRISIYRKGPLDPDGYGEPDPELVHRCWAKFSRTSGREIVQANADFGEVKVRFLIRWTRKLIERKMFVRYRGTDYEIVYVNDYADRREYLELWCEALSRKGTV